MSLTELRNCKLAKFWNDDEMNTRRQINIQLFLIIKEPYEDTDNKGM